ILRAANTLHVAPCPTNRHTLAPFQSAQADFAAKRSEAFRRGFNRSPYRDQTAGTQQNWPDHNDRANPLYMTRQLRP
ncbi:MAG: hypothetical protein ACXVCT_22915, partial [Ktedonobacterales bacterium]